MAADPFGRHPVQPLDVNNDGAVDPLDALTVLNALRRAGGDPVPLDATRGLYLDVDGDGSAEPLDALAVLNGLRRDDPIIAGGLIDDTGSDDLDYITRDPGLLLRLNRARATDRVRVSVGDATPRDVTDTLIDDVLRIDADALDELFGASVVDGTLPVEVQVVDAAGVPVGAATSFDIELDRTGNGYELFDQGIRRPGPQTIILAFDEPVATDALTADALTLFPGDATTLVSDAVEIAADGLSATFTFSADVPAGEYHYDLVADELVDDAGNVAVMRGGDLIEVLPNVPQIESLDDITIVDGSPRHVGIAIDDVEPGGITTTVTVADPSLVEASVLTGNRSVRLEIDNFGDIVFELFEGRAPRAAGRVATLVESGFYDGITFHRIIENFVIQAGDPTGVGNSGSELGPFDDEFHPDLQHSGPGVMSFAKTSDDTNNSQFFITDVPTHHLDFNHSVFGQVTRGDDVRRGIDAVPVVDGRPVDPVVITRATLFDDDRDATLFLRPLASSGSTDVTVTATDADGNATSRTFAVTLTPDTINAQPYLAEPSSFPIDVIDGVAQIQLGSIDLEDDSRLYFVQSATDGLRGSLDPDTGLLLIEVPDAFAGVVQVVVGVTANRATSDADTQTLRFELDGDGGIALLS